MILNYEDLISESLKLSKFIPFQYKENVTILMYWFYSILTFVFDFTSSYMVLSK